MTLDEAIKHCEEVADRCAVTDGNRECEDNHRQLAEWLKELKQYREWLESFNSDSATDCFTAVRNLRSMVKG